MSRLCPICFETLSEDANYCPRCGKCLKEKIEYERRYAGDSAAKKMVVGISDILIRLGDSNAEKEG